MDGLAFDTAFIIALGLPGLFFYFGFSRSSGALDLSFSEEGKVTARGLIYSLLSSLILHVFWCYLTNRISQEQIDFQAVFALLMDKDTERILTFKDFRGFTFYLFSLAVFSYIFGLISGWFLVKNPFFNFKKFVLLSSPSEHWHRLLSYPDTSLIQTENGATAPTDIVVTVHTSFGSFIGICWAYRTDKTGSLLGIILMGAFVSKGVDEAGKELWCEIEGEVFDIQCGDNLKSIEVDYIWLDRENGVESQGFFIKRLYRKFKMAINEFI